MSDDDTETGSTGPTIDPALAGTGLWREDHGTEVIGPETAVPPVAPTETVIVNPAQQAGQNPGAQSDPSGYPQAGAGQSQSGPSYPPSAPSYPPAAPGQSAASYPPAAAGYPQSGPSYPQSAGYPQGGYPQSAGYPQDGSGYPQSAGYPQGGYPQAGYPGTPAGYPQSGPSYPQSAGYPFSAGSAPSTQSAPSAQSWVPGLGQPAPFQAPPQPEPPKRRSPGLIVGIVAIVLAIVVGGVFGVRALMNRGEQAASSASGGASPSGGATVAGTAGPVTGGAAKPQATGLVNSTQMKPSPELVRQIFAAPDMDVSWVALSESGQTAVAYSTSFTIDGKAAGADGGHLIMTASNGRWTKMPGGVIVSSTDCSALMALGRKESVAASAVTKGKFCDPEVVYQIVSGEPLTTAGLGPLRVSRPVDELSTTQIMPSDLGTVCTRSTPPLDRYSGFVSDVWTSDGKIQAFSITGGTNKTAKGAGIGTSLADLQSIYGSKLTDVTTAYPTESIEQALAISYDGSEVDFLISGGSVSTIIVRESSFSTSSC